MQVIKNIVSRNMKKYIRDKAAVFFSFLSVLIVLFLYLIFLGDMQVDSIKSAIKDMPNFLDREKEVVFMVNSWLVAGLLAVNAITIPLGILSMKVEDKYNKIEDDFNATPAKRYQIVMGYIISAWIIGIVTSLFVLVIGEGYILIKGGSLLSLLGLLKVLGIISLSTIMFSGMFYLIVMFLKTVTQVSTINTLVGTFSGFLGGIYVPIGVLGVGIGSVIKLFPLAHSVALLRQVFMEDSISAVFSGTPSGTAEEIREFYGVDLFLGSHLMTPLEMILIMVGFTIICYGVSFILFKKLKRNS